jgi:hypothetical protein
MATANTEVNALPKDDANLERGPSRTSHSGDEKASYNEKTGEFHNEKGGVLDAREVGDVYDDIRDIDMGEDGKERPIVTDVDVATRLISLEDDPSLPCLTFRSWFLGLGLSCFGAVLGQIFYFRPQTVYVSQLFLQIIAYILGVVLENIVPGPNQARAALQTKDTWFFRFLNPGPFSERISFLSISPFQLITVTSNRHQGACRYHHLCVDGCRVCLGHQHFCC